MTNGKLEIKGTSQHANKMRKIKILVVGEMLDVIANGEKNVLTPLQDIIINRQRWTGAKQSHLLHDYRML
jgi:hypothetical protein